MAEPPAVYPLFLQDTVKANQVLILLTLHFNDVLDVELVRSSLSTLLRIGHWRKLTGRHYRTPNGNWELRVPARFTPQHPDFTFTHQTYAADLASHPLGKLYPSATKDASTQPIDVAIKPLLVPHEFPTSFDEMVKQQWPQLTLSVSSFNDATILSLLLPHTAMDASAITSLLENWSLVMAGAEGKVESVYGRSEDPLRVLDSDTETMEPHILDNKRMKWLQVIAFVARFVWRKKMWPAAETRVIYLPEDVLDALKSRTTGEAQIAAPQPDAFISEGDVLAAWLTRATVSATRRKMPATMLDVVNIRNRISALGGRDEIFLQNMLGIVFTPLSVEDTQGSVGKIALLHRRAITEQLSEQQATRHLRRMRRAIRKAPLSLPPVFYGRSSAVCLVSNNVSKSGYVAAVDFSPAVSGASMERQNPPGTPVFGITMPAEMSHMMGFNSVWGKDNQGGFWLSATMCRTGWDILDKDIAELSKRVATGSAASNSA
ncbi:carbohydrate esterase family 9 protein [Cordyceps fumosorosea ARSEF 2679]|uniref:Carbohydrate esterase family 9 protein n=1 Tax=Cordyceps fumosorosea (strain ARSEF 2679) TaxID=1081104 RepID=A0A167KSW0_CORFA|nr:carbohydrate esterase family 9 protein [Cordyceps fumosorosea ARSEF 2679]OAA52147.1 carbohydrate esterase family 9 protein [Cordyceps fumosorosea ARSEF 2679]